MSKYYYNKDFFQKIDNEEKAYWLGFLYADGCINRFYRNEKLKAMNLEIGLCKEDESHLEKFLKSIESNVEIKYKKIKLNGKSYDASRITICCTKTCRDLIEKGCTPQKSLTLKFPSNDIVPENLMRHFIRGYFDGDGCVSVSSNNIIQINFIGTKEMLDGISNYLRNNKIIYKNPSMYKKGNAFEMFIYGADVIEQFFHFLYDDAIVYLDRKYNKFYNFYDTYNLYRKSSSGKQGVYFDKHADKWIATICLNGVKKRIGAFIDKEKAIEARKNFEIIKYAD